jgi:hypothetical protein
MPAWHLSNVPPSSEQPSAPAVAQTSPSSPSRISHLTPASSAAEHCLGPRQWRHTTKRPDSHTRALARSVEQANDEIPVGHVSPMAPIDVSHMPTSARQPSGPPHGSSKKAFERQMSARSGAEHTISSRRVHSLPTAGRPWHPRTAIGAVIAPSPANMAIALAGRLRHKRLAMGIPPWTRWQETPGTATFSSEIARVNCASERRTGGSARAVQ